jgi:hypothetical protein
MEHTNTLCGQNVENLYIETGGTLDIKGLNYLISWNNLKKLTVAQLANKYPRLKQRNQASRITDFKMGSYNVRKGRNA